MRYFKQSSTLVRRAQIFKAQSPSTPTRHSRRLNSVSRVALGFIPCWDLGLFWMPGKSYQGEFLALQNSETVLREALRQDLQRIAVEIGARNEANYERLNATKTFLTNEFTKAGYNVAQQEYQIDGQSYENLAVEKRGTEKPDEIIVIGGHYDTAYSSPGADDNGTGVVATLELAKIFATRSPQRTIRFVEFTNEEPPFFWTENMGSLVYAKALRQKNEKIVAMLSLEMLGYFDEAKGSQKYPFPIGLLYPDRGNFIGFIGNVASGKLVRSAIASFRRHTAFPSEGAALPSGIPGVGWSDHWSFWQQGYPAMMITDTAPYRYPYYHTFDDTIDKIDFDRFARIVGGLVQVIADLSDNSKF